MSLDHITAVFTCDNCGAKFSENIDAAYKPPKEWSMFEVAEDSIRWRSHNGVTDNGHLCSECFVAELRSEAQDD